MAFFHNSTQTIARIFWLNISVMLAVVKECYPSQGKFSESLSFRPRNFSILANCNPGLPSYIKTIMFVYIQKLQTAIWILLKLEIYRGTALSNDFTIKCIFQSFRNVSNYFVVFFFVWRRTADITLFARPDYLLVHKWNAGRGFIYLHFLSSLTFTFKIR